MTVNQDIRQALEAGLDALVGLPQEVSGTNNIAWENRIFIRIEGEDYLRAILKTNSEKPASAGANSPILHEGLFLVDVFVDEDAGPFEGDALADLIKTGFAVGNEFTVNGKTVRIRFSEKGNAFNDPPFYAVPVVITWFAHI